MRHTYYGFHTATHARTHAHECTVTDTTRTFRIATCDIMEHAVKVNGCGGRRGQEVRAVPIIDPGTRWS